MAMLLPFARCAVSSLCAIPFGVVSTQFTLGSQTYFNLEITWHCKATPNSNPDTPQIHTIFISFVPSKSAEIAIEALGTVASGCPDP